MIAEVFGTALFGVPVLLGLAGLLLPAGDGGRPRRRLAAGLGIAGAAIALAEVVFLLVAGSDPVEFGAEVVRFGDLPVTFGVSLGPAALYVALAVTVVALLVQIYSVGYLHDDPRYAPYAAQISIFTGAMLMVVAANDLILLLVGWEIMGACSYLLIGHDRRLPEAPRAAVKAFLVTRVGDVGFLLGIALLGVSAGSFRIADVLAAPPEHLTIALLLILAGVAGKSAQFPLHTWLPDAMAGPTPISALIHAATMVAAGVYVVFRLFPLFARSPGALAVLGVMAAITLLLGAFSATAQDDLKRVLAWSTVSQIGYMTGALAVGAPAAALFHLLTHAAFKALLFLAAGGVIHAVGTNLMSRMGGLRTHMPVTFWSFVIGLGALAGLPPLAGFWSKENVLVAAAHATEGHGPAPAWVGWVVWLAGLLGVAITAWYATRLLLRTFFGHPRSRTEQWHVGFDDARYERGDGAPHDPPALIRWPVLLLTVPAALLGLIAFVPAFRSALELEAPHLSVSVVLPMLLLALGAGSSWWLWHTAPGADPALALGRLRPFFAAGFRIDDLQDRFLVRPVRAFATALRIVDERVVDAAVEGTGTSATRFGTVLSTAHRAALPRAAVAVLAGALVLGVVAAIYGAGS
ncbi:NADH-quinone oxidoreductase subunit 5 family protein [Actinoplanes friuliensis]|uniref:Putative NADH dehydrogenase I chain L n=1 Tax=Actinoplanes friuliensis DSM 7358 TaxID=1246995 RepID=U5VQR8_9ACTN|nr:NADH-quinone oxidoreductase subunit L [Actinoplanes friuliensis]AGZ39142.1 putative NADH dehydrogenase I chain L [Actinoplanes friuliensis DSM 7358]